jgi:acetyltransferase-like isoleucine patch superfamily enzyme
MAAAGWAKGPALTRRNQGLGRPLNDSAPSTGRGGFTPRERAIEGLHMSVATVISENIRVRVPDDFTVGEGSIIDDFCYFSTRVSIGRFCHIANGVSVAGGRSRRFTLGSFSSISSGVRIWCTSDDFGRDMAALLPPSIEVSKNTISGDVNLGELTIVGSNSVVMPANEIPDGVAIGALSLVPPRFEFKEWCLYAGIPIRLIRKRERDEILRQRDCALRALTNTD